MAAPIFHRVRVDYLVQTGSRISWELDRHFVEPLPYMFQLQVSYSGVPNAGDWQSIGVAVVNTYFMLDPDKRLYGKSQDVHYRVRLITGSGNTYYSDVIEPLGNLDVRAWLEAREIVRKELLRHRALASPNGYMLTAARYGPSCVNSDPLTDEPLYTKCPLCYGVGIEPGYHPAIANVYCDVLASPTREHRNPNKGMEQEDTITGRFIGLNQLQDKDVWVNKTTDARYFVEGTEIKAAIRGVPVVYECRLRLAPYGDIIYTFPLQAQTHMLSASERLGAPTVKL